MTMTRIQKVNLVSSFIINYTYNDKMVISHLVSPGPEHYLLTVSHELTITCFDNIF